MTHHPSVKAVKISSIINDYGAAFFHAAFARFVVSLHNPNITRAQVEQQIGDIYLSFQTLPAFHHIKFWNSDALGYNGSSDALDSVHITPARINKYHNTIPARFDTVFLCLLLDR